MVRKRTGDEGDRFAQFKLNHLDEFINLVIQKKFKPEKLGYFFIWMASLAWEDKSGKSRNSCIVPIAAMAKQWDVNKSTIGKWLSQLTKMGLIRVQYFVKIRSTGEEKPFWNYKAAWNYKNENGGSISTTHVHILGNNFMVHSSGKHAPKGKNNDSI